MFKSLKKQKCKDFEHLIIDGKSTDKTIKIIKKILSIFHSLSAKPIRTCGMQLTKASNTLKVK